MKKTTIEKIVNNPKDTVIGRYTYHYDAWTGKIYRCLTTDIGRRWIDSEGNQFDGWKEISSYFGC